MDREQNQFADQGEEVEGVPVAPSDLDPLAAQIGSVWQGLMAAMTHQGASREDIAQVAARTSAAILELTSGALWPPEQNVPNGERKFQRAFQEASGILEDVR